LPFIPPFPNHLQCSKLFVFYLLFIHYFFFLTVFLVDTFFFEVDFFDETFFVFCFELTGASNNLEEKADSNFVLPTFSSCGISEIRAPY